MKVAEREIDAPFELHPPHDGRLGRVFCGRALVQSEHKYARAFVFALGVLRYWRWLPVSDPVAIHLVALHIVINQEVLSDASAYQDAIADLVSVPELWATCPLDSLIELHDALIEKVVRVPRPANADAVESRAAALYEAGRAHRQHGRYDEAEAALAEACKLAESVEAWNVLALAKLATGRMYAQRGNAPRARSWYTEGINDCRRHELRIEEGMFRHDAFALEVEMGNIARADELAAEAVAAHGHWHQDTTRLAHDIGVFWLRQGEFENAMSVMMGVLQHPHCANDLVTIWGNVAEAAGGSGNVELFERATQRVSTCALQSDSEHRLAYATLALAQGALNLGLHERAYHFGRNALQLAENRREMAIVFQAEAVIHSATAHRPSGTQAVRSETRTKLAHEIVGHLRRRHASTTA